MIDPVWLYLGVPLGGAALVGAFSAVALYHNIKWVKRIRRERPVDLFPGSLEEYESIHGPHEVMLIDGRSYIKGGVTGAFAPPMYYPVDAIAGEHGADAVVMHREEFPFGGGIIESGIPVRRIAKKS